LARRQGSELIAAACEKRIGNDDEGAGPLLHDICKGYFKIAFAAGEPQSRFLRHTEVSTDRSNFMTSSRD
jgi:hypothetical protein